uniref:Uncharacterized protein n=1 Tax=Myripristis murdjan TaxID=586833 RepID=A0A667XGI2_9TELE
MESHMHGRARERGYDVNHAVLLPPQNRLMRTAALHPADLTRWPHTTVLPFPQCTLEVSPTITGISYYESKIKIKIKNKWGLRLSVGQRRRKLPLKLSR